MEQHDFEDSKLQDLIRICLSNLVSSLSGNQSFGYCSIRSMAEEGITSLFTSNFASLFNNYQIIKYGSLDNNISIMHQSYAKGDQKYGYNDIAIYYQFKSSDRYCFSGQQGLFPMIFMEFTKTSTKTVEDKLPQSSLYANYLLRHQNPEGFRSNRFPILGVTFSESSYVIILYSFTIHEKRERISEVTLHSGNIDSNFLKLIICFFDNYINLCLKILRSPNYKIENFFSPVPGSTVLMVNDIGDNNSSSPTIVYKAYDYRSLSGKSSIAAEDRRDYNGYQYARFDNEVVVSFENPDNILDSLVILKYTKIEGTHQPVYVRHLLDIVRELSELHLASCVFGDIRLSNMIFLPIGDEVDRTESRKLAYLIDFDMAGVEGEKTYSRFFNVDINDAIRHPDAVPLNLIQKSHDCFSLASVFDCFEVEGNETIDVNNSNVRWKEAIQEIRNCELQVALGHLDLISSNILINCPHKIAVKDLLPTGLPKKDLY